MYRQKNTVGNLENVGFSVEGHEGIYNVLMMEEKQTIFAVGAGAVTKLVKFDRKIGHQDAKIMRLFRPKYPYEYLSEAEAERAGQSVERCEDLLERAENQTEQIKERVERSEGLAGEIKEGLNRAEGHAQSIREILAAGKKAAEVDNS
jgi:hypothetical protein